MVVGGVGLGGVGVGGVGVGGVGVGVEDVVAASTVMEAYQEGYKRVA